MYAVYGRCMGFGGQCSQQYLHIAFISMAELFSFSLWLFILCENNNKKLYALTHKSS